MPKIQIYKDEAQEQPINVENQPKEPNPNVVVWESSKENIQPITQGRKIDTLLECLTKSETKEEKRAQYEERLKSIEDPNEELDLWCEYIDWLEQTLPDGGKVNEISSAIERCVEQFHDKKQFKQDKRLFNTFMKFRRFCDEPAEIFHFMYANAICTLHAELYLKWSWQCELQRNMKRAEDLIKLGLKNLASPRELLEEAHQQLKTRINIMISNGETLEVRTGGQASSSGPARSLQALKFRVSKTSGEVKVPVNRMRGAMGSASGGLKSQAKQSTSRPQVPTEIFSDQPRDEISRKVPTTQSIKNLGKIGDENARRPRQRLM